MADVNANIGVNIDTSGALANLRALQKQISAFHSSMAKSGAAANAVSADMQQNLINTINRTGKFAASMRTVKTTTESFTTALEKNKLSMGEYFRYAGASTKTFGRLFQNELGVIDKVARERVKTLQTQYIKLGRDASGAMKAISVRPLVLDMESLATQTAINTQKQQLFNQLLKQGSTNLLNWGKNTQWAGRQLMVGFTIPLTVFGTTAAKTFMDMEKQALRFRRVYGDLFTPAEETNKMVKQIQELAAEFTKYGVAIADTMGLAADVAAMGKMGADLTAQVAQATRLAVLGNVEQAQALETTISVTNAFGVAASDLAGKIDFLNAVENQTVTSIEDLTIAIPKAGPVVQQLGGDVEDLAFFLTAMKEGGINASEGANALKSGLASLINPTEKASIMLQGFGVNLRDIVESNKGNVAGIVVDFAKALDTLDPLTRARAIEQLFGKFQFSRLSTLFQNVIQEGTQANRVLELAGATSEQLARLSASELGKVEETLTFKFQKAIEDFKLAIAPIGEQFLKFITPIIEFGTKIINKFNEMDEGIKGFVANLTIVLGGLGPVLLMTIGLAGNFVANLIKGFATFRNIFDRIRGVPSAVAAETEYMTQEQLQSLAVSASLEQAHNRLKQAFTSEAQAVDLLTAAYSRSIVAQRAFSGLSGARGGQARTGYANGVVSVPGPKGAGDIVPAMLSPGEAVIPAAMAKQYAPLIQGMIAGNIPGYSKGVFLGMPKSGKSTAKNREAADQIYKMFLESNYANTPPTEYGHQISPTSGHSFPIFGLGGVYQKGNKQVFVKPVLDEKAALAEMRSTEISRRAHGLEAPEQRIVVIRDPMDPKRQRRFLALESDLDPKFVNNAPMGIFNEEQYFRQLVASLLRADKDLSASNVYGNVVADAGPGGVFSRASGLRDYAQSLPSMEEQAMINLLGIKGGAKRAFAESTLGLMAGLTPEQYHQRMIAEIQKVLPALKQTIASFGLTNPTEVGVYDDMVRRLEAGLGVNWRRFHEIHSAVKIAKPKQTTSKPVAGYANGVVSVPGPKGKGDVVPAMLSPGEAVIPTKMAKKYAPLINAMIAGNIPGYVLGKEVFGRTGQLPTEASHLDILTPKNLIGTLRQALNILGDELGNTTVKVKQFENGVDGAFTTIEMTMNELAAMPDATEILLQGVAAAGSTVVETRSRNQGFEELGFPGSPTSLQGVIELGDRAEAALRDQTNGAHLWAEEYQRFVAAAAEARQQIQEGNGAQAEFNYMLERMTQAYSDGLIGSQQVTDANEADARATARMTRIREEYDKELLQGISSEQALQNARAKAVQALIVETSLRDRDGNLVVTTGSGGSFGSHSGRQLASGRARGAGPRGAETRAIALARYDQVAQQTGVLAEEFAIDVADQTFNGMERGLRIASPSGKFEELADNVSAGVDLAKDDAKKAGEAIGVATATSVEQAGTRRIRRASTNPETMAAINVMNAANASQSRQPRRATSPAGRSENGQFIPVSESLNEVAETAQRTKRSFSELLSTASTLSFGLTSLAGIGSMAGGALAEFSSAVFQISGTLFAVNTVLQVFQTEMVANRIAMAKQTAAFASYGTGLASRAGLGGMLGRLGVFVRALLGPVGLVTAGLTALAGVILFVNNLREEEAKKIKAFGDAAFLSSEKLKTLADIFDVTVRETSFAPEFTMPEGLSNIEVNATEAVLNAENFKTDFAPEIGALAEASPEQAQALLESMQLRLETAGFGPEAIKAIISAITIEAKRTELSLDFLNVDAISEKGITDLENKTREAARRAAKAFDDGFTPNALSGPVTSVGGYSLSGQTNTGPSFTQTRFGIQSQGQAGGSFTAEAREELSLLAGEYANFFNSIKVGVEDASSPASVLQKDLDTIISSLEDMSPEAVAEMFPQIAEKLQIDPKAIKGITDVTDQINLLQAAAMDINVAKIAKDLRKAEKSGDLSKQIEARRQLNDLISQGINLRIQENVQDQQESVLKQINDEIAALQATNEAKQKYADLGLSAAAVNLVLTNSAYEAAIANAELAKDMGLVERIVRRLNKLAKMKDSGTTAVGSATPEKDPYKDVLKSLMSVRLEQKLVLRGLNSDFIQTLVGLDKAARDKFIRISDNGTVSFTKVGKAMRKAFDKVAIGNFVLEQRKIVKDLKNQKIAADKLVAAGLSYKEAWEAVRDTQLATALATAKNAKAIKKIIDAFKKAQQTAEEIMSPLEKVEDIASKISEFFGRKRTVLEAQFNIDTANSQKAIMSAENEIEGLNFQMDDLNAGIQEIEWQEEAINAKYKDRFDALDKIQRVNEQISKQNKSQLSIAEALSSGDIGAAARAIEDLRSQQAEESLSKQRQSLEIAQQKELAALTNSNGKTREELEKAILEIQKQIFKIEETRLEPAQRAIELKQNELDLALFALDQQQSEWDILYTQINNTLDPLESYVKLLQQAKALLSETEKPGTPTTGGTGSDKEFKGKRPGPDHDGKKKGEIWVGPEATWKWDGKKWNKVSNVGKNTGAKNFSSGGIVPAYLRMGGLLPYKSEGGSIFKPLGTDTIPAMLTPGEFVLRKPVVDRIGVGRLKDINNGASFGGSVYNYEVNVNVATNANANEIARTVISQIKQIDNQRIRGVRL